VYCLERDFLPGDDGEETDRFDRQSGHVLLIHRESGQAIGTVRIVPPSNANGRDRFPMTGVCPPSLLNKLPDHSTGEISRFAVSKERRLGCHASNKVRLGLMQGIVRLSAEMGLTHWCAVMEPILLRLLQMNAIHFVPLGPLVEYHGMRQPAFGHIGTVLDRIRSEQPDVWNYITLGGTLCHEPLRERLVA